MSIRFTCLACKTVLKIGEMISEQRKVRCTGCSVVILLTPDPDAPDGMSITIPQQAPKPRKDPRSAYDNPWVLAGVAAAALLIAALGIWWYYHEPTVRGAVEGQVTLDTVPLQRGHIRFIPIDNPKAFPVTVPIVQGRYEATASNGPFIGKNKWEITGSDNERVAARFNVGSKAEIEIKAGVNNLPFDVSSK